MWENFSEWELCNVLNQIKIALKYDLRFVWSSEAVGQCAQTESRTTSGFLLCKSLWQNSFVILLVLKRLFFFEFILSQGNHALVSKIQLSSDSFQLPLSAEELHFHMLDSKKSKVTTATTPLQLSFYQIVPNLTPLLRQVSIITGFQNSDQSKHSRTFAWKTLSCAEKDVVVGSLEAV